ncbi:hypothetical protein BJ322DRAFT_1016684 [Thelephora terrestris]|uniref:Uncharacterized protein n=1 Tax=Thelephora terrestris TaxID=56493 RepID=A0A9P6LCW9_9AGAM|nr:hypothetical protein BJ322DRAFT_1016684 [Thelephora terrestris]
MDPIALMKTRPRSRCNVLAELGLLSCSSIKCEWSMLVWSASVEACSAIRLLRFYIGHTTASGFPWPCLMGLLGRLVDGGFLDPQQLHLGVDLMFTSHYSRHPGSKRPPGCRPSGTAEVWSGHPQLQARCQQFWRSDSDHNPPVFRILVFYARILSEIIVVIFARLLAFRAPTEELDIPSAIHTPVFLTPKAGAPKLQRCGVSTIANDIRNVGYPSPSPTPRMKSLVMLVATVDTCPSTLNGLAGAHITVIQFSTQFSNPSPRLVRIVRLRSAHQIESSALLKDCNVPTDESNEDVLKCLLYTPRSGYLPSGYIVLFGYFLKDTHQFTCILPTGYMWVLCERTLNEWLRFVMGTLESKLMSIFQKVAKKYLVGNDWANGFKTHNVLTMYPLLLASPVANSKFEAACAERGS